MLYNELQLPPEIEKAVDRMGFVEMTEVQQKAIPPMMEGEDVIAKAPTGTGKTCAFGIPLLTQINANSKKVQGLILAPTRELAQQITSDLRDLAHYMPSVKIACLYGGQAISRQLRQLKAGPQIVVATPGRLQDHMNRRSVNLDRVTQVVLDEADEMLDMGFYHDVRRILDSLKNVKQLGMFSATISREVMDIGWLYQRNPVEIDVEPLEESMPRIDQYSIKTTGRNKLPDLAEIIVGQDYERVMVFCNTRNTTSRLADQLKRLHFDVEPLHGDMNQAERTRIMERFKSGEIRVLVATDVAARGIDVENVDAVVNYDVPNSNEYYTHRIGRTGRAQKKGVAYILYIKDEEKQLEEMIRLTRNTVTPLFFNKNEKLIDKNGVEH